MRCSRSSYIEVLGDRWYPCASGWVDIFAENCTMEEAINSPEFKEFKESIENGSYSHCLGVCPTMVGAKNRGDITKEPGNYECKAKNVNVGIDGSCLLACKACRGGSKYVEPYDLVQKRLKRLEDGMKMYGTTKVTLSSCGDPIFSKSIRQWLQGFKQEDYPKLKTIQLRTNAQLFTESFWNSLGDAKKLIKSLWISIDAATRETYEELRVFGSFERLWKNLNFIGTIPEIQYIMFSFVVQKKNAGEIEEYHRNMTAWGKKYGKIVQFYFQQAGHWPGVPKEMFDSEIDLFADKEQWEIATKQLMNVQGMQDIPYRMSSKLVSQIKTIV